MNTTGIYRPALFYRLLLTCLIFFFVWTIGSTVRMASDGYLNTLGFSQYQTPVWQYTNKNYLPSGIQESFARLDTALAEMKGQGNQVFRTNSYMDLGLIGLETVVCLLFINVLFFTRLELTVAQLKIYTPPLAIRGPFTPPLEINLSSLHSVRITRTTPLGPDLTDPKDISWRDRLDFDTFSLPGFFYSHLDRFYADLLKLRPDITTEFYKNTISDNLREYPPR